MKSVNIKEKGTRNENFFFWGGGAGAGGINGWRSGASLTKTRPKPGRDHVDGNYFFFFFIKLPFKTATGSLCAFIPLGDYSWGIDINCNI